MFKPSDTEHSPLRSLAGGLLSRASVLALLVPISALSGVSTVDGPEAPKPAVAEKLIKAQGTYQIRCWQEGRLLFEENHVALPADGGQYGVKMAGSDRQGRPIYVADTRNATCLIRASVDDRTWRR